VLFAGYAHHSASAMSSAASMAVLAVGCRGASLTSTGSSLPAVLVGFVEEGVARLPPWNAVARATIACTIRFWFNKVCRASSANWLSLCRLYSILLPNIRNCMSKRFRSSSLLVSFKLIKVYTNCSPFSALTLARTWWAADCFLRTLCFRPSG
jgi:hypothetical protein